MVNRVQTILQVFLSCVLISTLGILIHSCKEEEEEPAPVITDVSPDSGRVGTTVTITGSNFHSTSSGNTVRFNGVAATVSSNTTTTLVVQVPEGATTGPVTVTVDSRTATFSVFTVITDPPAIEAVRAGGTGFDVGYGVAVDIDGNTYVGGSFQGDATFGSTVLTATSEDGFLAKYDADGNFIWVKQLAGQFNERVADIALDNQGNIYITGYCSSPDTRFGPFMVSPSSHDGFIARVDPTGEPNWLRVLGDGQGMDDAFSIALDNSAGVFISGYFSGSITIGTTTLTANGGSDVLVAKYNADTGNPDWGKQFGGVNDDYGNSIAVYDDGIYIGGSFFGTFEVPGMQPMESVGALDAFVTRLDLSGEPQWAKQIGGNDWDMSRAVSADANGDCIVGGYFIGGLTLETTTLNSYGNEDIFLSKLSSASGNVVWAKSAGGSDYDNIKSIDTDQSGNIYVTGHFARNATFDNISIESPNFFSDVFVAKYSGSGNVYFVRHAGGPESDFGEAIAVDASGIIYATGSFRDFNVTFGDTELVNTGGDDIFLWKIWPEGQQ